MKFSYIKTLLRELELELTLEVNNN